MMERGIMPGAGSGAKEIVAEGSGNRKYLFGFL
jgi:hypothetical protein